VPLTPTPRGLFRNTHRAAPDGAYRQSRDHPCRVAYQRGRAQNESSASASPVLTGELSRFGFNYDDNPETKALPRPRSVKVDDPALLSTNASMFFSWIRPDQAFTTRSERMLCRTQALRVSTISFACAPMRE